MTPVDVRVDRGEPDDDELAALVAALLVVTAEGERRTRAASRAPASGWTGRRTDWRSRARP